MKKDVNQIWSFPNMILIAGDGRNVGKTTLARQIIRYMSHRGNVTGIKTSPHFHAINDDLDVLYKTSDYIVAEEKGHSEKDSSLFLQAGAKKVFFIMAKQEYLAEAFSTITNKLDKQIIVAESGGLNEFIEAGIFFFIRNKEGLVKKEQYLKYNPIVVMNGENGFDFNTERLDIRNNQIVVN